MKRLTVTKAAVLQDKWCGTVIRAIALPSVCYQCPEVYLYILILSFQLSKSREL